MAKNLNFFYDKKGDILDVSIGKAKKATSLEIRDDIFVRLDKKNEVVGFMILNFEKHFSSPYKSASIPVMAEFNLPQAYL